MPLDKRTLQELVDLRPHMVAGDLGVSDRVIYEQVKGLGGERRVPAEGIFPPVTASSDQLEKLGLTRWRIDFTRYSGEDLATGELNRSKGHVNTNRAVEVFQVLSNRIRMLLQNPRDPSKSYFTNAGEGDCILVPPGWYHSTHVLEGPADVINIVNREGFTDWSEKGYQKLQAAYTFTRNSDGEVISVANPAYPEPPILIELQPTELPILKDFSDSIFHLVHQARPDLLERFADDILSANPSSSFILPQKTIDGVVIPNYYQPVYSNSDNLIPGHELRILGLTAPPIENQPMTYLEALGHFLKFSDQERQLLIDLPDQLGKNISKDAIKEWLQMIRNRLSMSTDDSLYLGPNVLWQMGYKIVKSFETSGSSTRTFLSIDSSGRLSVVKYSDQEGVNGTGVSWLRNQAARMEEYQAYLGNCIPAVLDTADLGESGARNTVFFYSMEYRPLETLSDYLLYNPDATEEGFFIRLGTVLDRQIGMLYDYPETWVAADREGGGSYLYRFYIDRFRRRLALLADPKANLNPDWIKGDSPVNYIAPMFADLMKADTLTLSGRTYKNLPRLLELMDNNQDTVNQIGPRLLGLGHGDGHAGNIGFEIDKPVEEGFVLFDLRGMDVNERIDIGYDMGKLAFSFLHSLVDRAHAFRVPPSSLVVYEGTRNAQVSLEVDASQENTVRMHLELRNQFWDFLQKHQPIIDLFARMGEEPARWFTRARFAEAIQMFGPAPDRLKDDPSGEISLTYYVLTTILLNDFLTSYGFDNDTKSRLVQDTHQDNLFRFI